MHSFWGTFKAPRGKKVKQADLSQHIKVGKGKQGYALKSQVEEWKSKHPNIAFPVWGDFTGIASTSHGPKLEILTEKVAKDHPALKRFPEGFKVMPSELYNNYYITDAVKPILKGTQENKDEAIIMWESQQGKGKVMGLTLGHYPEEWEVEEFQNLIIDGVNSLVK
jgi:type 1 glutamine amidotransferase